MPYVMTTKSAGDEISSTYEGRHVECQESDIVHPSHTDGFVDKGDPVLMGKLVGVAFRDAAAATDIIAVDTEGIWALSVVADNDAGGSAVARCDRIYINKTTAVLSKIENPATNEPFGIALSTLTSHATGLVAVKVHQDPEINVGQDNLEDEVTYSQYICFGPSQMDTITIMAGDLESDCDVVHVSYWTSQALGTGLGIDLVDGGADGSGSAVIDSCSDNLSGLDDNELATPYAMLAGEVLKLTVDNVTDSTWIYVKVTLKVVLNEEP
jgi:predicted RecA/RadA family phage recombinase